jgi:hypothetical protein
MKRIIMGMIAMAIMGSIARPPTVEASAQSATLAGPQKEVALGEITLRFTRVRFTPYVGYLVGFQRYDDITANFVDAPPDSMPGLAAQDGKFFEKSWALSLGPTAGLLVGLGPFELSWKRKSAT